MDVPTQPIYSDNVVVTRDVQEVSDYIKLGWTLFSTEATGKFNKLTFILIKPQRGK
jgi:hypothetical protein